MPVSDFLSNHHIVNGLYPVADAFATTGVSDVISLENYESICFIIHTGNSTGGDSDGVVTVSACDTVVPGNSVAMAFRYRTCASSATVDTWSSPTAAASTGVALNGADNTMLAVEVTADEVLTAGLTNSTEYSTPFVQLTVTEDTDDPVVAGILCILSGPRYPQDVPVSAIA
jgi:hypothetical protein